MVTLFVRMERRMIVLLLFSLRLKSEEERKKISRSIIEKLCVWRVFVERRIEVLRRCDERSLEEDELPVLEEHQGPIIIHDQEIPIPSLTRRSFSQHCIINYIYISFTIAFKEIKLLSARLCRSSCRINHLLLIFYGKTSVRSVENFCFANIKKDVVRKLWNLIKKVRASTLIGSSKTVVGIVRFRCKHF